MKPLLTAKEALQYLTSLGAVIRIDGEDLRVRYPPGSTEGRTREVWEMITPHKPGLLALLAGPQDEALRRRVEAFRCRRPMECYLCREFPLPCRWHEPCALCNRAMRIAVGLEDVP